MKSMIKSPCTHPEILQILASAGHHAKILIADGNYPASTKKGPNAKLVYLNLRPGSVTVDEVLRVLLQTINIEAAHTMGLEPTDPVAKQMGGDPPVWTAYRASLKELSPEIDLESALKWDFYKAVECEDHVLTIVTGDQHMYANLLLTQGVVQKGDGN